MTLSSSDTTENGGQKSIFFPFCPSQSPLVPFFYLRVDSKNVNGDRAKWSVYSDSDRPMDFREMHFSNKEIRKKYVFNSILTVLQVTHWVYRSNVKKCQAAFI